MKTSEEKKNIFEAINEVMKDISPISKDRKNAKQGYNFRGIDDAMNAMSPLFTKHGIFPTIQSVVDIQTDEVESANGNKGYHYVRRFTIRFYSIDGSFVDVISDGEAIDYGDKASNKAMSVAYREAIFKTFVIPFGNDDIENHDHNVLKTAQKVSDCPRCGNPMAISKAGNPYCPGKYNGSCNPKPEHSEAALKFIESLND